MYANRDYNLFSKHKRPHESFGEKSNYHAKVSAAEILTVAIVVAKFFNILS